MENTNVVNDQPTPDNQGAPVADNGNSSVTTPTLAPGSKTDSALLLQSLQEEREKRRVAEARLQELESQVPSGEFISDEGKVLTKLIENQNEKISQMEDERQLEKVYSQFPVLKEAAQEFETYRADYPKHKLENVAKLFLVEKGLMESTERKGLEKPTGGDRTPPQTGITTDEVSELRKNNFNKYMELIKSGKIRPEDIK